MEKYLVSNPADVDGDCLDDITELGDPVGMNPLNPAAAIELINGAVAIPDQDTLEKLFSLGVYGKFVMFGMDTPRPGIYFMNTETYMDHVSFLDAVGIEPEESVRGEIVYDAHLVAPDGSSGAYRYELAPHDYSFNLAARVHTVLAADMSLIENNLVLYVPNIALPFAQSDLPLFKASRIPIVFNEDISPETRFLALNPGVGYGRLQVTGPDDRPHPRDIVIYEALPNDLSRVAGIISTVPQTPLSHVNLRAVQNGIPNAFIRGALDKPDIDDLLGSSVRYQVTEIGYSLRAATPAEVDAHYAASRPSETQTPERDLTVTSITPLSEMGFDDWDAFGVKAANVAVLGKLGFPGGTVPDGFPVPFYFYDEFMKANGFYDDIEEMLADPEFQSDYDAQEKKLKKLRKAIKKGETPQWIVEALTAMHAAFPEGTSLRYRSSTNNEDLPGFNGAGLYDSKTQHPDETKEDGIAKSLKQVYASLWNFRAFTERDFHRVDHMAVAMGVLVHPNYSDELANGVAVSFDPVYGRNRTYYVNTQLGEDLVTNPETHSVPEEILLSQQAYYTVLATSNQVPAGQLLMSDDQLYQLRRHLTAIHDHFATLYGPGSGEPFAVEIEFKITSENILAIKQARPWVFSDAESPPPTIPPPEPNTPATGTPTIGGTAQVGETLTADTSGISDADGLDNITFSYQWTRNDGNADADISGATGPTYTLVWDDEGETVRVRVSFRDDANNEERLTSEATAEVAARSNSPAPGAPTIGGTAQVGETLTSGTSGISDPDGLDNVTFSYQWTRNDGNADADISGATGSTYTLVEADEGKTVRVGCPSPTMRATRRRLPARRRRRRRRGPTAPPRERPPSPARPRWGRR